MFRALIGIALITFVLSLLGALIAPPKQTPPDPSPPKDSRLAPQQLVGFALNVHHSANRSSFRKAIDELAELGFNSIEVTTPCFQSNGASDDIRIVVAPGRSPPRAQLVDVLNHARQRGLTTLLMPVVLFTDPRGNEWRGKIQPDRWTGWWDSYRRVIDDYIDIAIEADVQNFCVGSELISTEQQTEQWRSLIAYIRQRFSGRLLYSTNWDHYQVPNFWKYLDMIGINGYWDLTVGSSDDRPSPDRLADRWRQIRQDVLAFAESRDRPVLFTEIGYPSLPWALKDPWNYIVASRQRKADVESQRLGYAAFLSTWGDILHPPRSTASPSSVSRHRLAGVFFYEWDLYRDGGPRDTGYGVRGKPALDLLKTWLRVR